MLSEPRYSDPPAYHDANNYPREEFPGGPREEFPWGPRSGFPGTGFRSGASSASRGPAPRSMWHPETEPWRGVGRPEVGPAPARGPPSYKDEQVPFYNVNQLTPPTIISGKLSAKRVEEVRDYVITYKAHGGRVNRDDFFGPQARVEIQTLFNAMGRRHLDGQSVILDRIRDQAFFSLLIRALTPEALNKKSLPTLFAESGKKIKFDPVTQTGLSIQSYMVAKDADVFERWDKLTFKERERSLKDFVSGLVEANAALQTNYSFVRILEELQRGNRFLSLQIFFENIITASSTFRDRRNTDGPMTEVERARHRLSKAKQPQPSQQEASSKKDVKKADKKSAGNQQTSKTSGDHKATNKKCPNCGRQRHAPHAGEKNFCPWYKHPQCNKDNNVEWADSEFGKAWIKANKDDPEKFPEGGGGPRCYHTGWGPTAKTDPRIGFERKTQDKETSQEG